MPRRMIALGLAAAVFAAGGNEAAATVKSACQIDISAEEASASSRRSETVGFIKNVEGKVSVFRKEGGDLKEIDATVGMDIFAQDAIATSATGAFDVIFTDNSTLSGVADTCVEIANYVYKPAAKQGDFRMRLGRGVVSVAAGEVAKIKGDTMSVKVRNDTNLAVTGTRIVIRAK